jgi:hypothetical protein
MGRRIARFDTTEVARRIASGYGQGTGRNYKPWLTFRDISSRGVTTRFASRKLERTVTLFSNIERNAFMVAEFLHQFLDYHEQGPMAREITIELCRRLGIRHPNYFGTRIPAVLTYDGLLFRAGQRPVLIDCKHSGNGLGQGRDQEAYALRNAYADHMGYKILRVTDESYSRVRIHNLHWMRTSAPRKGHYVLDLQQMEYWSTKMFYSLVQAIESGDSCPVRTRVKEFASEHGHTSGLGLVWLRRLLLDRHLEFDLETHYSELLRNPLCFLCAGPMTHVRGSAVA